MTDDRERDMADHGEHQWEQFVQAHGQIIGYDYGEFFMPVDGSNPRAIRIHEELAPRSLGGPGVPVYAPVSSKGARP